LKPTNTNKAVKVAVFLKANLGSCDAIIPILIEAKSINPKLSVEFHLPDTETYSMIRKNVVLWDGLHHLGRVLVPPKKATRWGTFRQAAQNTRLIVLALLRQITVVHFTALASQKIRILCLVASRKCYHFNQHVFGFPALLWESERLRITKLGKVPNFTAGGDKPAGARVFFDHDSPRYAGTKERDRVIVLDPPRRRQTWLSHLASNADRNFNAEFPDLEQHRADGIITIMTSGFSENPLMRQKDTMQRLFMTTIDTLAEISGGRPIVVKPHFEQDVPLIEDAIARNPDAIIRISHMHAGLLALSSKVFIANWASTTLGDALAVGVPTVEFSDYGDELLELTHGGSVWPELATVFINKDQRAFREAVVEILRQPSDAAQPAAPIDDPTGLYHDLAFGRPWQR
jgi:hypothetical protein